MKNKSIIWIFIFHTFLIRFFFNFLVFSWFSFLLVIYWLNYHFDLVCWTWFLSIEVKVRFRTNEMIYFINLVFSSRSRAWIRIAAIISRHQNNRRCGRGKIDSYSSLTIGWSINKIVNLSSFPMNINFDFSIIIILENKHE